MTYDVWRSSIIAHFDFRLYGKLYRQRVATATVWHYAKLLARVALWTLMTACFRYFHNGRSLYNYNVSGFELPLALCAWSRPSLSQLPCNIILCEWVSSSIFIAHHITKQSTCCGFGCGFICPFVRPSVRPFIKFVWAVLSKRLNEDTENMTTKHACLECAGLESVTANCGDW